MSFKVVTLGPALFYLIFAEVQTTPEGTWMAFVKDGGGYAIAFAVLYGAFWLAKYGLKKLFERIEQKDVQLREQHGELVKLTEAAVRSSEKAASASDRLSTAIEKKTCFLDNEEQIKKAVRALNELNR